mmetsp:Transcript_878/g.1980  ORF Transcript_878/g.1980 Transcript_878/m.1980 type:complete len:122 (-) Transcript_878:3205-3570(-)
MQTSRFLNLSSSGGGTGATATETVQGDETATNGKEPTRSGSVAIEIEKAAVIEEGIAMVTAIGGAHTAEAAAEAEVQAEARAEEEIGMKTRTRKMNPGGIDRSLLMISRRVVSDRHRKPQC